MTISGSPLVNKSRLCLGGLLLICFSLWGCGSGPTKAQREVHLDGAGATFPALLYKKWIIEFEKSQSKISIAYDVVGSGEGTKRFLAEKVDFGASDAALTDEQITETKRGAVLVPVTAGAIALAYNLPGIDNLKLSRDTYAKIFLGKIERWNDPTITKDNPGVNLPNMPIGLAVRSDGSGTTYVFSHHMNTISKDWQDVAYGVGKYVIWQNRTVRAQGNSGVGGLIKTSPGMIGYVELGHALRQKLKMAHLENQSGKFIAPTPENASHAFADVKLPDNLRVFMPDPSHPDAYPIVGFSWILAYKQNPDAAKTDPLKKYLKWCLQDGQKYSLELGYVPLPKNVVEKALIAVDDIQ